MNEYSDEREQIEAIKRWFKINGIYIIGAVLVAAVVLGGRAWWQEHVRQRGEAASEQFQQLILDIEAERGAAIVERGSHIINAYEGTPYAPLAAFAVAKAKVAEGDLASARTFLQWALDNSDQKQMRHVARLRLARLLLADGDPQGALNLVESVKPGEFASPYGAIKGDIYVALNQPEKARAAYQQALDGAELDPSVLRWKINSLPVSESATGIVE